MIIKITFVAMLLCPTVLGQTEEFKTLDTLGARLQKQEANLEEQKRHSEEQDALLEKQKTHLEHQDAILGEQATLLDEQKTRLEHQDALLEEQKTRLGHQDALLEEQKAHSEHQDTLLEEQKTRLQEKEAEIANLRQQTLELARGRTSSTYVRWGRTTCPGNGSELVYSGYVGGSHFTHTGAAVDYLCLPTDPSFAYFEDNLQYEAFIYGAEYEMPVRHTNEMKFFPDNDPDVSLRDKDVPCAVCKTMRSTVLMVPARTTCHDGWTLEYTGYLSAGRYNHAAASQYVCLDGKPEYLDGGGTSNDNGVLFYFVEGRCGSLRCPPYQEGWEITCAVCSI